MLSAQTGAVPLLLTTLVYIAAFAIALGPIPWVLGSELFPTELRGRTMAIVALAVWVACYAVTGHCIGDAGWQTVPPCPRS